MVELEVPLDQEEEERIWSAFKQASPTELTGGEEALDKNRILKFRKSEGKGDSRGPDVDMAIAEAAEADKGAEEDKQQAAAGRGRSHPRSKGQGQGQGQRNGGGGGGYQRSQHQGGWGSGKWSNWKKDDEDDKIATLKFLVSQLAKLCLRHEDSINMWRAESSFVLFVRTGIPGSLVPSLYAAKTEWQKIREETPEKIKRPMRNILFSCLLKEMNSRLTILRDDTKRRESMEKLGWLKGRTFSASSGMPL